jgi:hypothetical protein
MFILVDMDTSDASIDVMACQFFGKKLTIHSIDINANTLPRAIDVVHLTLPPWIKYYHRNMK